MVRTGSKLNVWHWGGGVNQAKGRRWPHAQITYVRTYIQYIHTHNPCALHPDMLQPLCTTKARNQHHNSHQPPAARAPFPLPTQTKKKKKKKSARGSDSESQRSFYVFSPTLFFFFFFSVFLFLAYCLTQRREVCFTGGVDGSRTYTHYRERERHTHTEGACDCRQLTQMQPSRFALSWFS